MCGFARSGSDSNSQSNSCHSGRCGLTYRTGHSELLLRSVKLDAEQQETLEAMHGRTYSHPTRIDLLFKGVTALRLRSMDFPGGLRVRQGGPVESAFPSCTLSTSAGRDGQEVFVLDTLHGPSFVVALTVRCHEDNGSFCHPSFFDHEPGAP